MKKILYILIFICSINIGLSFPSSIVNGDTINYIDNNNLKQGFWRIFGKMQNIPEYEPDQVIEEGKYSSSKKEGLWTKFFPNGKTKSEIEYINSRPNGSYKTYYDNGQLEEQGNWKNNRNTGEFKRHYPNGQLYQEFIFNETGKRDGTQKYYFDNGKLMIDAKIKDGKEEQVLEYNLDGTLKSDKIFIDGKLDVINTKIYSSKIELKDDGIVKIVKVDPTENTNKEIFSGEGQHKIYNMNKQISKDGFFKNYRLMDGLWYKYDENGILINIEIFKQGKYIGESPITD